MIFADLVRGLDANFSKNHRRFGEAGRKVLSFTPVQEDLSDYGTPANFVTLVYSLKDLDRVDYRSEDVSYEYRGELESLKSSRGGKTSKYIGQHVY